ncbi:hypothetical protein D3C73_844550 [compost metagenome]
MNLINSSGFFTFELRPKAAQPKSGVLPFTTSCQAFPYFGLSGYRETAKILPSPAVLVYSAGVVNHCVSHMRLSPFSAFLFSVSSVSIVYSGSNSFSAYSLFANWSASLNPSSSTPYTYFSPFQKISSLIWFAENSDLRLFHLVATGYLPG